MLIPLARQVAPLALCLRLQELGAPRDTLFQYRSSYGYYENAVMMGAASGIDNVVCPAYTAPELGLLLPRDGRWFTEEEMQGDGKTLRWRAEYTSSDSEQTPEFYVDGGSGENGEIASEAEARALLLIQIVGRYGWKAGKR